jgi:hypothetical protein
VARPRLHKGYAWTANTGGRGFRRVPENAWRHEMVDSEKEYFGARYLGVRTLHGRQQNVWHVADQFFAQPVPGSRSMMETVLENPISRRTLWIAGIGATSVAAVTVLMLATAKPASAATSPSTGTAPAATSDPTVLSTLQALMALAQADLCTTGNSTVIAFQTAWNNAVTAMGTAASGSYGSIPATGQYDQATASVAYQTNTSAPSACTTFTS